jgi:hypothetical protein
MTEEAWQRKREEVGWAVLADWGQAECSLGGGAKRWKSALVGYSLGPRCFELQLTRLKVLSASRSTTTDLEGKKGCFWSGKFADAGVEGVAKRCGLRRLSLTFGHHDIHDTNPSGLSTSCL